MTDVFDINSSNLNNFIEKLNNNDKCTMIFVFANWCGHCKAMKPEMTKFKQELKADNNVPALVAFLEETDMNKNKDKIQDLPFADEVNGFPTIVFRDEGDDKFTSYSGDRTHQAFMKFIKQHAMKGGRKKKAVTTNLLFLELLLLPKLLSLFIKNYLRKKERKEKQRKEKVVNGLLSTNVLLIVKNLKDFLKNNIVKEYKKEKEKQKKNVKK